MIAAQPEGIPYLHDRADGVHGHYCIGVIVNGTSWFWNKGKWAAFGEVFDLAALPERKKI